jgi:Putative redox-active protein (C_GCAxxG_C_C)
VDDVRLEMLSLSRKGYYCSQIILALGLEAQGKQDPDLIRAAAGLALGAGDDAGTCGALTGAACLIALHGGKGQDSETEADEFWLMLAELWEWFRAGVGAVHGGVGCGQILSDGASRKERCGPIIADAYAKAIEILVEHGFAPTEPRNA